MSSPTWRIHPAIGIARVGDAEDFYLGPEAAGGLPLEPDGRPIDAHGFRAADGRVRRQAARFRVYRYDEACPEGRPVDLDDPDVAAIEWTVHVANKKASWYAFQTNAGQYGYLPDHPLRNATITGEERHRLVIDPGPRTVSGRGAAAPLSRATVPEGYPGGFPGPLEPYDIDTLGEARTDGAGNLLVLGGYGRSGTFVLPARITEYANNDGWFDDTSDGRVAARLHLRDGSVIEDVDGAWVLVGPPAYAPQIENLVTLYDTMRDTFVRSFGTEPEVFHASMWQDDYEPSFEDDILPILERAGRYRWVVAIPPRPHRLPIDKLADPDPQYNPLRQFYVDVLRSPSQPNPLVNDAGQVAMPYLAGDNMLNPDYLTSNFLTVSPTQYFMLRQWASGRFVRSRPSRLGPGERLDRAVLENCVGGAFSPGIEMTWICRLPELYAAPFRLKARPMLPGARLSLGLDLAAGVEPGDVTKLMATPWQADFNECAAQPWGEERYVWWWPAQRPIWVRPEHAPHEQRTWVGTAEDQNAPDFTMFADDLDMVSRWKRLGFVVGVPGPDGEEVFVEVQRQAPYAPGS
ncbi:MAG TPA: LodA/GoxA family CTQ-dependent oxidase [Myxococcota bacterium]|nr:LodA/GoxA family CTQ-dependent oxidase [Myxococcota bacterium]